MNTNYECVVIGCSAGGIEALSQIFRALPDDFGLAIIVVIHLSKNSPSFFQDCFSRHTKVPIKEADEKEPVRPGNIYFAPANYHLLMEADKTFSLSTEAPLRFSRPSIDIFFETAADCYRDSLLGIILSGANADGSQGLQKIKSLGGTTLVQDPSTAAFPEMPQSAVSYADFVYDLSKIAAFVAGLKPSSSIEFISPARRL